MQVFTFTLFVYLIFHVFTYEILVITCLNKQPKTTENFLWKQEINFRREIPIKRCCHTYEELLENKTGKSFYCSFKGNNETHFDYMNVDNENEIGIPKCKIMSEDPWRCVDMLYNRAVELYCAQSTIGGKTVTILRHRYHAVMRKCCPINEIYDSHEKKCVSHDDAKELVQQHFHRLRRNRHSIISNDTFPMCPSDKVVVEHSYNINNTDFPYQRSLMNHLTPDVVVYNFCLDLASDRDKLHWIIQACESKDICDSMPCIRKCCMVGEMIKIGNTSSNCVPYKGSIKSEFYQVRSWSQPDQRVQKVDVDGKFYYPKLLQCLLIFSLKIL